MRIAGGSSPSASERLGALDLVINNAGVGAAGQFETHDPSVLRQRLRDQCLRDGRGLPRVVASPGRRPRSRDGHHGLHQRPPRLPGRSEYCASKFAVTGFTESIRVEWRRFGIHVLQVNPGFTDTPFDENALVNTARVSVKHRRTMSPDAVARATLRPIERHRREITLGWQGKLFVLTSRFAPGSWTGA